VATRFDSHNLVTARSSALSTPSNTLYFCSKIAYSMYAAQSMCHPSALWSVAINTVPC
jgi:hypothetical protein